jgi:hypothetical protein
MLAFLVLGLIPGTNIQIGFNFWAGIFIALVVICLKSYISYYREVKKMTVSLSLRRPLPANQLHSRLRYF